MPSDPGTSVDVTGIAVALGRIEEKVSHLSGLEDRMRNVENQLAELRAQQRPKTPWWVIIGGVAGTVTALLGFWTLFQLASNFATTIGGP